MKKTILTVLAAIAALVPALAGTIDRSYSLRGFTGIRASNAFQVHLTQSPDYSVNVEAPDYLESYIKVEVSGRNLVLSLANLPASVQRKLSSDKDGAIRAEVHMPTLESVSLSGAARLKCDGAFPALRDRTFLLDMSGATHADGLSVPAPKADIRLSGASQASLEGRFDTVSLDASGASKIKVDVDTSLLEAELTGSAHANIGGALRQVKLQTSGASRAEFVSSSALQALDVEGSGAASIDARSAKSQDVRVRLSGASNCRVSAVRAIEIEASGASTCQYEAAPDTKVNVLQVARGATVRKL
ncbi:MAG: DUF2807 domain-containing protein [Bacteroidales bacterium]|nr:DUF2807 domain-containing protein [Bacteroidales bacterium]